MTPDPAEAAHLAFACMAAEAAGPVAMAPVASTGGPGGQVSGPYPPVWLLGNGRLLAWITGQDAILEGWLNLGARRLFYGWVIEDATGVTVIIRGTQNFEEWAIDGTFLPRISHPLKGEVETGFWNLFCTLRLRTVDGVDSPLIAGLQTLPPNRSPVTVTGHSLGAAVATLITAELAQTLPYVRGRFIASPRPGNQEFAEYFADQVTNYAVYAYERDLVPRLPCGLGYCALPNLITLPASSRIKDDPLDNHHAGNYGWLIDPTVALSVPGGMDYILPIS